jgi:hypothetical protein
LVVDHWLLVIGRWLLVVGPWSLVIGRCSLVVVSWLVGQSTIRVPGLWEFSLQKDNELVRTSTIPKTMLLLGFVGLQ